MLKSRKFLELLKILLNGKDSQSTSHMTNISDFRHFNGILKISLEMFPKKRLEKKKNKGENKEIQNPWKSCNCYF